MAPTTLTATDRQRFARARARGRRDEYASNAVASARYDKSADAICLEFRSGPTITIPRGRIPALADLSASQLDTVTVSCAGDALSWRSEDIDIAVGGLIRALLLFPT